MRLYTNLDQALILLRDGWELHCGYRLCTYAYLIKVGEPEHQLVRMSIWTALRKRGVLLLKEKDIKHAVYIYKEPTEEG